MCYQCSDSSRKFFVFAKITDKKGRLLSFSNNSYIKTHPLQSKYAKRQKRPNKEFLHAEIGAIIKLKPQDRERAYRITVYRFDLQGKPKLAKPCPICLAAIKDAGIKEIYYTKDDDCCDLDFDDYRDYQNQSKSWC